LASLFEKLKANSNNSQNNNNIFNSNINNQSSNGFDNTDRPMGYKPQVHLTNVQQVWPNQQQSNQSGDVQQQQNNVNTQPPNNNVTNTVQQNGGFQFQQPPQPQNTNVLQPQQNMAQQQVQQQPWTQEHYTYAYPSKGEIWGDLALRVFEVVIGAAAIAAGNEIARFFTRRRFQPTIRQIYEHPNNQVNSKNNNQHTNGWWNGQ